MQEWAIDNWPYWLLEENIKIVNQLTEEEEKQKKKQEDEQGKGMPNFNPGSYMNSMNNMASKFKH